jgi:hypothetical protein
LDRVHRLSCHSFIGWQPNGFSLSEANQVLTQEQIASLKEKNCSPSNLTNDHQPVTSGLIGLPSINVRHALVQVLDVPSTLGVFLDRRFANRPLVLV